MNDEELEQVMRSGLRSKAGEVEVGSEYAALAHEGARTQRHTRVGLVAAATAAVIVASVAVADRVGQEPAPTPIAGPTPTSNASPGQTGPTSAVPDDWRVESYNGVQLYVPPDWGWGGAPLRDVTGGNRVYECGQGAFARPGPDGQTVFDEGMDVPYVGRSGFYMTDICAPVQPPTQKYAWFGAPIEVGTDRLDGGFVQETVEVNGVRVTVADDDPQERATILDSLEPVEVDANGCVSTSLPEKSDRLVAVTSVESVSVCQYRHDDDGRNVVLGYSTLITGSAAQHVLDTIRQSPAVELACNPDTQPPLDSVLLRFHSQSQDVDVLVRLDGCGGFYTAEGVRLFTRANVTPWVVDGVGLYASGGQIGNAISGFIDRYGG